MKTVAVLSINKTDFLSSVREFFPGICTKGDKYVWRCFEIVFIGIDDYDKARYEKYDYVLWSNKVKKIVELNDLLMLGKSGGKII